MKKTKKITALVLSLLIVVGLFAACGNEKTANSEKALTYWVKLDSRSSQTISSFNEMLYYQEVSKATGIDVEFLHPSSGSTGTEAFQVMMASGNYPDIIEYNWAGYAGGPDAAINDGVIIALNDYLKDFAPNYYDYMEGEKGKENDYIYKAQSLSGNGNYYGFSALCIGNSRAFSGFYVRKDKLDEWGLDVPVTIDDWSNLFKTAKENGIEAPFVCASSSLAIKGGANCFNVAYNVGKSFYLDGDVVKFGPFEKSYKDYIAKMAEWMKLGYIDKDYVTNTSTEVEGFMTNGKSIATIGFVGGGMGKLLPAMAQKDPNYDLVACPYPVLNEGDEYWGNDIEGEVLTNHTAAISVECGKNDSSRYETAVKWLDYAYDDEGSILKIFGVEGDTYTIQQGEDGKNHYVYTDKIYDHEKIGAHSVEAALYKFMRPSSGPGFSEHPDYLNGFYPYQQQKDAVEIWNEHVEESRAHILPPLSYTDEEAGEIAAIQASEQDNLDAAISNIILGKASIDTYDAAVEKARNNGYDRMLEIRQNAYDRYLELKK